jgi:plasmid stabilization system protein ParE
VPHTIEIFPRAMADIQGQVARLNQRAASAAARWHAGLLGAIRSLANNPQRAALADEAVDVGVELRQLLYGRRRSVFHVLFTVDGNTVNILRVCHAAQDRLSSDDL